MNSERPSTDLNSVSVNLHLTELNKILSPPHIIHELDWSFCMVPDIHKSLNTPGAASRAHTAFLGFHGGGCHVARTLSSELSSDDGSFTSIMGSLPAQNTNIYPHTFLYMNTAGSYTDFHVDFGGSSSWAYLMKGEVWYYFIPPTPENVRKYEDWLASSRQNSVFFGDSVSQCYKCELSEGSFLMLPAGWIHGMYCPKDAILFGGNFFSSLHMEMQVLVQEIEQRAEIPQRFLYPKQYTFMWYAAYWYCRQLLKAESDEAMDTELEGSVSKFDASRHLTSVEYTGLCAFVAKLGQMINSIHIPLSLADDVHRVKKLHSSGAGVPQEIDEPRLMLFELRRLLGVDETFAKTVEQFARTNQHSSGKKAEVEVASKKSNSYKIRDTCLIPRNDSDFQPRSQFSNNMKKCPKCEVSFPFVLSMLY